MIDVGLVGALFAVGWLAFVTKDSAPELLVHWVVLCALLLGLLASFNWLVFSALGFADPAEQKKASRAKRRPRLPRTPREGGGEQEVFPRRCSE